MDHSARYSISCPTFCFPTWYKFSRQRGSWLKYPQVLWTSYMTSPKKSKCTDQSIFQIRSKNENVKVAGKQQVSTAAPGADNGDIQSENKQQGRYSVMS